MKLVDCRTTRHRSASPAGPRRSRGVPVTAACSVPDRVERYPNRIRSKRHAIYNILINILKKGIPSATRLC